MELTLEGINKILTKLGHPVSYQKETDQLYLILSVDVMEFPIFLKILPTGPILQAVLFFPFQYKENNFNELSKFLHFINKFIDIPGFCLEEKMQTIFYRFSLPLFDNQMPSVLSLERIMQSLYNIAKTVTFPLLDVTSGVKSAQTVIDELEKHFSKANMPKD